MSVGEREIWKKWKPWQVISQKILVINDSAYLYCALEHSPSPSQKSQIEELCY